MSNLEADKTFVLGVHPDADLAWTPRGFGIAVRCKKTLIGKMFIGNGWRLIAGGSFTVSDAWANARAVIESEANV